MQRRSGLFLRSEVTWKSQAELAHFGITAHRRLHLSVEYTDAHAFTVGEDPRFEAFTPFVAVHAHEAAAGTRDFSGVL